MKLGILHLIILFKTICIFGQISDTTMPADADIKALLLTLRPTLHLSGVINLSDSPCNFPREAYSRLFLHKKNSTFSDKDIDYILRQYDYREKTKWTNTTIDSAKFIKHEFIDMMFKRGPDEGWRKFGKKYGWNFYEISIPLLNINKDYCLIRTNYHCGDLCGEYLTLILKLVNGKWEIYKTLAQGYS